MMTGAYHTAMVGLDREQFHESSHHEAGHAAGLFLLGLGHDLHFIEMAGSDERAAFIRRNAIPLELAFMSGRGDVDESCDLEVRQVILENLIGWAAECRLGDGRQDGDMTWLDEAWDRGDDETVGTDLWCAWRVGQAVTPTLQKASKLLTTVAGWCDELVADPGSGRWSRGWRGSWSLEKGWMVDGRWKS